MMSSSLKQPSGATRGLTHLLMHASGWDAFQTPLCTCVTNHTREIGDGAERISFQLVPPCSAFISTLSPDTPNDPKARD